MASYEINLQRNNLGKDDDVATTQDLCFEFAGAAAEASYERLPPAAVEAAKKSVLDALGVIIAGSGTEPAVRAIVDLVREEGGRPESSILGFGGRVPAVMAAFANGAMAHCLDYDDQTPWGQHAGSSILPAVFALAERRGGVTGKEMITAIAVGQDFFNRMRCHVDWRKDWNFTTVVGVLAATVAGSVLLRLPRDRIANAFGIASMQCCGSMNVVHAVGSNLRALYAGFPAKGAVLATLLAERGVSGAPAIFEGEHGIMDLYFHGTYDRAALLRDLGRHYMGEHTLYKRWPTVGTAHSHIHATIELVTEHALAPDDIAQIRVHVGDYHRIMCEPIAARQAPATLVDAKFSLPYLVAVAAVHRAVGLRDFTAEAIARPVVLAAAQRVVPVVDDRLDWKLELPPGRVEIVTRDGRRFERIGTNVPGSAEAPMTWDELAAKFADCASAAIVPPAAATVARVVTAARTLESADDATELMRALSP